MKKLLLVLAILSFCMSTASALQISTPTLSGERNANVSTTVTITNDGSAVVSNLQLTSTADSKYNIRFENIPQSIAPSQSAIVTIKGSIPKDFEAGKKSIGTITVTSTVVSNIPVSNTSTNTSNTTNSSNPLGTHTLIPANETPQQIVLPVGMSAANDCGQNTEDPGMPIIGQWHTGSCDWLPEIEVMQPLSGQVDAGWARVHSSNFNDYWVNSVSVDCSGQSQNPPQNWIYGGKIHSGPGLCDGNIELPSGDSGWTGFYTRPEADGQLIVVIADNKCGGGVQQVPVNGVILGRVRTGPGVCDGLPEAFAYNGASLDSGSVYIVYLPIDHTPTNFLPIGVFESLSWTSLSGWAFDNDTPATKVNVYVDGTFWKELTASVPRQDLVTAGLIPDANHGFNYTFTQSDLTSLDKTKNHSFHIYAINSPQGDNPMLNGSPKTLAAQINVTNSTNTTNITNTTNTTNTNSGNTGTQNASTTASATLYMEAQNRLIIDKVKINCDTLETVTEGSTIDNIAPGQSCTLTVRVKNTFTNTEIEDITIEAEPESSDVDGDSVDVSSLDAGDSQEKTLELKIDESADGGKVDIDVTAEGRDENGVKHSDKFQFTLEIERMKHDLPISSISVNPTQAKPCQHSRIDVTVYVENKGERDEDAVAVELSVPALNFVKKIKDIVIYQDEEEKVTFSIPITSSTSAGSFKATAKSFFENVGLSQSKTADIVIVKCTESAPLTTSTPDTGNDFSGDAVVVAPPHVPEVDVINIVPEDGAAETQETFLSGAVFTGILVGANLIALTILGVMGYGYFRKPKDPMAEQFEDDKPVEETNLKDYY